MARGRQIKKQTVPSVKTKVRSSRGKKRLPAAAPLPQFYLRQTLGLAASNFHSVAWSPNGQHIAVGSDDRCIRIWNVTTGDLEQLLEGHQDSVLCVAWSPDGSSLASGSTDTTVRVWEARSGCTQRTFEGHQDSVLCVAWSPDGSSLASGSTDTTVRVWDLKSGRVLRTWTRHQRSVQSVAWSLNGTLLASASHDMTVQVWDIISGWLLRTFEGHQDSVLCVAWSPDGSSLASGSGDQTVRVWEVSTSRTLRTLEGHLHPVQSVAWSPDGAQVASGADDGEVRLWSTSTWTEITRYPQPSSKHFLLDVSFCAVTTIAEHFDNDDITVRNWALSGGDGVALPSSASVHSTSAKIVFVGESNAGKSCLALRLAEDRYEEQISTLGMKLWTLPPEKLDPTAIPPAGEKRDVTLWDLGGQHEYRLVHQLFLHDTTLALVLFDPTRGRTAFEEVEGWNLRLEKQLHGRNTIKLLVGTKLDDGSATIDQTGLQQLLTGCGFAGYFPTSAKTARGIDELRAVIAQALDWDNLAKTTRPVLFQRVRDEIDQRRSKGEEVLLYDDLTTQLQQETEADYEPQAVQTVVQQLTVQGVIAETRLTTGLRILVLQIGEIERYASSLIFAARNNPRDIPALEERDITAGRFAFPGIKAEERLHPFQERIVLESVMQLLIEHSLCFKHAGLLIFPSLFADAAVREPAQAGEGVSLYYDFSGPIDNIYSALVVTLALGERFGRVRLWNDGAEYEKSGQGVCGIRKIASRRGTAHLDLYFSVDTAESVRNLFTIFIEDHLRKEGVTITEGLQLSCSACNYRFEQSLLIEYLQEGLREIACPRPHCKTVNRIAQKAADVRASTPELQEEFLALKTIVEQRSQRDVAEIKSDFAKGKPTETGVEPIRILHLSDLHITEHEDPSTRLQPLLADLQDQDSGFGFERLDYLVLSGDLTNRATPGEFEQCYQLISQLIEHFELSAERCLIVPGNHDLSWDDQVYQWRQKRLLDENKQQAGTFMPQGDGYLVRDEARYPQRFSNFNKFYHSLVQQPYPLIAEEQDLSFLFPDTRLQFVTLNSAWQIDEFFSDRASINDPALSPVLLRADKQVKQTKDAEQMAKDVQILRLAVWHHPATGDEKIQQDAFLERLRRADVKLCLHGHVHEERADLVGYVHPRKIHVVGAGSFGAVAKDRPESTPRLYNVMEIARDHSSVKIHTRYMRKDGGAWEGWAVWPGTNAHEKRTYYEVKLK